MSTASLLLVFQSIQILKAVAIWRNRTLVELKLMLPLLLLLLLLPLPGSCIYARANATAVWALAGAHITGCY